MTRYYEKGLGGIENWEKISSLKYTGTLKLKDGEFQLDAYKKKPDLLKITVMNQGQKLILSYDGDLAWQHSTGVGSKPELMAEADARRFKHSAVFGNYLFYPYAEGKQITYIDTVPVEGKICHQIRVALDTDYEVDYFIDIHSHLEIKIFNRDLKTGTTNSIIYSDYSRENLMSVAMKVENYENGEWVSSLNINEAQVNSGIIPFMFKMRTQ